MITDDKSNSNYNQLLVKKVHKERSIYGHDNMVENFNQEIWLFLRVIIVKSLVFYKLNVQNSWKI